MTLLHVWMKREVFDAGVMSDLPVMYVVQSYKMNGALLMQIMRMLLVGE